MSTHTVSRESLQQALADLFAPWVQALGLHHLRLDVNQVQAGLGYNTGHTGVWRIPMSNHNEHTSDDPVEAVVKHIPVVIPVVGALLIFLLAFIAVFLA